MMPDGKWAYLIIISLFFDSLHYNIAGINIRPSTVVILMALLSQLGIILTRRGKILWTPLTVPILLFIFINIISTLAYSTILARSLFTILLFFIFSLGFFIIVNIVTPRSDLFNNSIQVLIAIAAVAALYGIISFVSLAIFGINLGGADLISSIGFVKGGVIALTPRAKGISGSATIYGTVMCTVALLLLSYLFFTSSEKRKIYLYITLSFILIALILSYSRGAWLGFGFGFALIIFGQILYRRRLAQNRFRFSLYILACILITVIFFRFNQLVYQAFLGKITGFFDFNYGTTKSRLYIWKLLLTEAMKKPLLGHGTDTYRLIYTGETESFIIRTIHSTGIIGILSYILIHLTVIVMFFKTLKRTKENLNPWMIPLFISYLGMFVSYQTNPGLLSTFPFVIMALLVAAIYQSRWKLVEARDESSANGNAHQNR